MEIVQWLNAILRSLIWTVRSGIIPSVIWATWWSCDILFSALKIDYVSERELNGLFGLPVKL